MNKFELQDFNKRINLNTDLENISKIICEKYNLGSFLSNKLIEIGYEDYNYILTTTNGKYVIKIFNKSRTKEDISNYLDRLRIIANSKVNTPKIMTINNEFITTINYENIDYDICVFEYINGKNFYELNTKPTIEEIKEIAKQTSLINNLNANLNFVYDDWAIINYENELKSKKIYLDDCYKEEFDKLLDEFKSININKLPKAFVHGDIINTNVIKDNNSRLWIIDYSVSNELPRIIDLAVISCNLCLDINSKEKTLNNIKVLLEEYNKYNKLTEYELSVFDIFYKLANAMHILQTEYLIKTEGDSKENQYWLNEGKIGYSYSKKGLRLYE